MATGTIKVRIFDIDYDTDGDEDVLESLPTEFVTSFKVGAELAELNDEELRNELDFYVDNFIVEQTGFCYFSYQLDFLND